MAPGAGDGAVMSAILFGVFLLGYVIGKRDGEKEEWKKWRKSMSKPYVARRSRRKPSEFLIVRFCLCIFAFAFGFMIGMFIYTPVGIAEEANVTYVCTTQKGTWVNAREAPSPQGAVVGTLRYGYEIQPIGEENGYYRIHLHDGKDAYVRREFFERPVGKRATVTSRVVTRAKPNGRKINHLNAGSWIDVLAETVDEDGEAWYRCYGNVYVMARYLEVE